MLRFFARFRLFFIVLLALSSVIIVLMYQALKPEKRLPVYQPSMVNPELVDSTLVYVKKYHSIADFKLINQNGDTISQADYADKIYVADFFFTTCPTICPVMTANMADIQQIIKGDDEVMLLSHSVTPEIDSVPPAQKVRPRKGSNRCQMEPSNRR